MIAEFLALLGSLSFLIAAIGLIHMPDSISRVHAGTKASSFGVMLFVAAVGLHFPTVENLFLSLLILVLVLLTAPMACQAIASRLIPPSDRHGRK